MRVILTIGTARWLCKTASTAGKISDLIGECSPLQQVYEAGSDPDVFMGKPSYEHDVRIHEITRRHLITNSQAQVDELIKKNKAKTEAK
jgi:hypothetical protein